MSAIHKMRGVVPLSIVGSAAGLVSTATSTTQTMGNIDVGAASADKNAIIAVTMSDDDPVTITGVTVGGVSLSESVTITYAGNPDVTAAIWAGDISSISGSQSVVVTTSGTSNGAGASGVSVSGLRSLTPTMTVSDSSTNTNTTLTALAAPSGGFTIACGANEEPASTATWESLTEKADVQTGAGGQDHRHTAAWDLGARSAADEDLSFTGASANSATAGASFR